MKLSTISTALTVLVTSAYAAEEIIETFVLFGAQDATGASPNYTQGIVVGSDSIHISQYFQHILDIIFSFSKPPQNLTIITNMFGQQRIHWWSHPLNVQFSLSTTTVLS